MRLRDILNIMDRDARVEVKKSSKTKTLQVVFEGEAEFGLYSPFAKDDVTYLAVRDDGLLEIWLNKEE